MSLHQEIEFENDICVDLAAQGYRFAEAWRLAYLKQYGSASRADLAGLVLDKLSEVLDKEQRRNKFRNLLYAMSRKDKTIVKTGGKRKGQWELARHGEGEV